MDIKGITHTTLNDYPGHIASTVFVGGCDFACPYCFNRSLVVKPELLPNLDEAAIIDFLSQRQIGLDAVVISGGEPLNQTDLMNFMYQVKSLGFKVKLDTNGYDPIHLTHILEERLVDYVAMDIKNSPYNYAKTTGFPGIDLSQIIISVDILKDCKVDYEFRTTVTRELHTRQDMEEIGQWLAGAKAYYLQRYASGDDVIMPIFTNHTTEELEAFQKILKKTIKKVEIR